MALIAPLCRNSMLAKKSRSKIQKINCVSAGKWLTKIENSECCEGTEGSLNKHFRGE